MMIQFRLSASFNLQSFAVEDFASMQIAVNVLSRFLIYRCIQTLDHVTNWSQSPVGKEYTCEEKWHEILKGLKNRKKGLPETLREQSG